MQVTSHEPPAVVAARPAGTRSQRGIAGDASAAGPMNPAIARIRRAVRDAFARHADESLVNEKFTDDFERQLLHRTLRTRAWGA